MEYNAVDIQEYNSYAKKSEGVKTYQIDRDVITKGPKRVISDVVKKVSEEITKEEEDKVQTSKTAQKTSVAPTAPTGPVDPGDSAR